MASEEAEPAVVVEAIAARARELVRALLKPGGALSVEDAGETVANSVRSCLADVSRKNLAVRSQDVEKLAVAAAAAALTILVITGAGSLSTPHGVVEEEIVKAVVAAATKVRDMNTSSDYSFAFRFVAVTFFLWVTTLAVFLVCLMY